MAIPLERGSAIAAGVSLALGLAVGVGAATGALQGATAGMDLTQPVVEGSWMAWTWAGALFFAVIALLLIIMILWAAIAPETPRVGILRIETTPGDRLFLTLLGSAFICLAWLAAFGAPVWGGLAASFVWGAVVFRWV
jgi:predicted small integral membrane protein